MLNRKGLASLALVTAIALLMLPANSQQVPVLAEGKPISDPLPAASVGNFSVIWITDTQYLSQMYPSYFDSLCRWIVNNAQKYNVKMVIHTGDLVDTESNKTQWEAANHSMSLLLDAGIPYCWNAGNHDFNETCWIGNQYAAFDPAALAQQPHWVGDEFNGQNTAVEISVSGWDLLVLNLQNLANSTALDWANSVLNAHPDSHAIVATHAFLNNLGKYTYRLSGQDDSWASSINTTVLQTHPNVFLTLSAHFNTNTGRQNRVGDRVDLMFDRQDQDSGLGAATLRILTFDTVDNVIDAKTFVLYANTFLTDTNDQFTIDTSFYNVYAQGTPESTSTPEQTLEPTPTPEFPVFAVSVLVFLVASTTVLLFCRGFLWKRKSID
jgi:hypothetical protein